MIEIINNKFVVNIFKNDLFSYSYQKAFQNHQISECDSVSNYLGDNNHIALYDLKNINFKYRNIKNQDLKVIKIKNSNFNLTIFEETESFNLIYEYLSNNEIKNNYFITDKNLDSLINDIFFEFLSKNNEFFLSFFQSIDEVEEEGFKYGKSNAQKTFINILGLN